MKRVSEIDDTGNEKLGLKKVKLLTGNDESLVALDRNEVEENIIFVENGAIDSAEVYKNGDPCADTVPNNHDAPSFGGLNEPNIWGVDLSYDSIFGIEEEQKGLIFDLNIPVYGPRNGGSIFGIEEAQKGLFFDLNLPVDGSQYGGLDQGRLEYTQGPMINENKVEIIDIVSDEPMINENKVEIINIVSDDSENEVEITGYTYGYKANDKQIESEMYSDVNRMDKLSLGLGVVRMGNALGESSLVTRSETRYTREEKGKASVVEADFVDDSPIDYWLSLKANSPINLGLQTNSDESTGPNDPAEDVEVNMWQPAVSAANSDLTEREIQRAEQALRTRERLTQETWRNTARRFARIKFPEQDEGNQSSKKQQPPTSRPVEQLGNSPGPFSDALKMVRERTSKRTADQLIEWRPSEENQDRSITAAFVPSLLDLSLKALAGSAEGIVSLDQVPDNLRARLTNILCDISKMNAHMMKLLVEGCPTEIRIKNCSWLTEEQFRLIFGNCQAKDLRVLQLDLCGQCMLDCAFSGTFAQSSNVFSRLAILSLRGACRLSDSGLKELVMSAPALRSINLGQCALLTSNSVNFIADYLGLNLRELYIDDCHKIEAMLILPALRKFRYLEVLSVAGLLTITDQFVSEIVKTCGRSIKELDLANCPQLTDLSLKTIGRSCSDLCSLNISNLYNLTDLGIEYLGNGCKSIQKLKLCRNDFSDEAVAALVESSGECLTELLLNNMVKVGPNTAFSLAKRSRMLLSLDVSWCRKISNEALGLIVDSCSSLKLLKVFGCRQITNVFLKGHSNQLVRIIGLKLGPILDHVNLLEPEEVLLKYSSLPICMEE